MNKKRDARRKEAARTLYESAVFHYSNGRHVRLVPSGIGATLLNPSIAAENLTMFPPMETVR